MRVVFFLLLILLLIVIGFMCIRLRPSITNNPLLPLGMDNETAKP